MQDMNDARSVLENEVENYNNKDPEEKIEEVNYIVMPTVRFPKFLAEKIKKYISLGKISSYASLVRTAVKKELKRL